MRVPTVLPRLCAVLIQRVCGIDRESVRGLFLFFCFPHRLRCMASMPDTINLLKTDRYLGLHSNYIGRELRVVIYSQFLQSYQSVRLAAMADTFGVTVDFLDSELCRFIAAGRLNCKIDKVGGVIETTRPDNKNALYQGTIKQGDALLNRIQKLSRVIYV